VKHIRIGFTIGFLVIALICLIDRCNAEDYIVPNFIGGINVATDSTDLAPNQALSLTNLTFDMPNVLTGREGYSFWNDSAFDGYSGTVQNIYDFNGKRFIIVGDFLYISPSLTDPSTIEWDTTRLHYDYDSISVTNGSDTAYDVGSTHDYLYLRTAFYDSVDIGGTKYRLSSMQNTGTDTILDFTTNYGGSTDTVASYTIYKAVSGVNSFTDYDGVLYICALDIYNGSTIAYVNDTTWQFLSIIDTGTVTSAIDLDTSTFVASNDNIFLRRGTKKAYCWDYTNGLDGYGIQDGDIFYYYYQYDADGGIHNGVFYSSIDSVDTVGIHDYITLKDIFNPQFNPISPTNPWEVRRDATVPVIDSTYGGLADGSKNWFDYEFGDELYTSFYAVISDSGYHAIRDIYNNDDTILVLDSYISNSEPYYIMTGIPTWLLRSDTLTDSLYKEFPRFRQIEFYNSQLYAIGIYYDYIDDSEVGQYPNPFAGGYSGGKGDRVWYSHPGYPNYIPHEYNFELRDGNTATVLFLLYGGLYIATSTGIWRTTGTPALVNTSGDQLIGKVVTNNGIPDLDNWVKVTEEYGYFTNRTGIYRFDGVRPEKISLRVDPIIQNNYASDIVMGYQDYRLYISFPDSNFTLVYDERYDSFTEFDFGMNCIYSPDNSDLIYFGLNGQNGRIYYYPNGEYWDRNSPTDSSAIKVEYKSGWQTYAGYWLNKAIGEAYFPMLSPDTATISIYSDFSGTADDVVYADSASRFVYRKNPDNDATGEYFQVAIRDTVYEQIIIGGYKIEWETADQWKK
jgi:hypothetical protein